MLLLYQGELYRLLGASSINFLTEDDKQKCEGAFSKEECLKALKKYEEQ
jgi:hypothetical protein